MTVSAVSVQICVICARRSWLPGVWGCGDVACQRHHAGAEGWADQHLRGLPVTGRRSWQYPPLGPAAGGWGRGGMEGQVGPWRTRGCGPAARTPRNLDPREAGWGPTCDCLFSLTLPPACRRAIRGLCLPACRSPCAAVGLTTDGRQPLGPRLFRLVPDRHLVSLPFGDRGGWDWLYFRPGRPVDQVLSWLGAGRSRQAAGGGKP
jgi:hypothetical protein